MPVIFGCAGAVLAALVAVLAVSWRVPSADEALVVSGRRPRVVRARGTLAPPLLTRVARVELGLREVGLPVAARSAEGVEVVVTVDGAWRVGDDDAAVTLAARHLHRRSELVARQVDEAVAGRVRSAAGTMAGADLALGDAPERLAAAVRAGLVADIAGLGLAVGRLEVAAIGDPTGYLADVVAPERARAAAARRIAAAESDEAAVAAEQRARTAVARGERDLRMLRPPSAG